MPFTKGKVWQELILHAKEIQNLSLAAICQDRNQQEKFTCSAAKLNLDYGKNFCTENTIKLLINLANQSNLKEKINALFSEEKINFTENRSVTHTICRLPLNKAPQYILEERFKIQKITKQILHNDWLGFTGKPINTVVNIGIGGSHLGPQMVVNALREFSWPIKSYFISNIDPYDCANVMHTVDAERTIFLISSKTFTTQETLTNANAVKNWLLQKGCKEQELGKHFLAITAAKEKAIAFGIKEENIFSFNDSVGGRYSLWSSIGLAISLCLGSEKFEELLAGANAIDEHFQNADLNCNMPVILALLGIWYQNFWNANTQAIIPYSQRLNDLVPYLQQLDMESNGKSIDSQSRKVKINTGAVIWGGVGTNGQHAFHQLLHQGTRFVPVDFILPWHNINDINNQHLLLIANCLAQARALMTGKSLEEVQKEMQDQGMNNEEIAKQAPHYAIPGNKPSNIISFSQLDPYTLGNLLAVYEHKVFVQGVIWDINSFDQFGVELGKELTKQLLPLLQDNNLSLDELDSSTKWLIEFARKNY